MRDNSPEGWLLMIGITLIAYLVPVLLIRAAKLFQSRSFLHYFFWIVGAILFTIITLAFIFLAVMRFSD